MDVVDLEKFRNQKAAEADDQSVQSEDDLSIIEFAEDADMSDIVFLTSDRDGVVVVFNPLDRLGAFLSPDQAQEIGLQIIRYATMARYRGLLMKMESNTTD